jgi:DNA-binding PadR family transcriptional regulator
MEATPLGRFASASFLILASLADGPNHGYAMMQDIRAFSGTHLEAGTLYGCIARLEQLKWIEALPMEDRRRPYQLTAAGVAAFRRHVVTLNHVTRVSMARLTTLEAP